MAKGLKHGTRRNYMLRIHRFAECLGEKNFKDATKDDIINYVNQMKARNLKAGSIREEQAVLKHFYTWLFDGDAPECVRWIKLKTNQNNIRPEDLLTEDEIKKMIDASSNFRNKAIISTLYESGCRISEFLNIKLKDMRFDEFGVKIKVDGKTGERDIRIVNSTPYIKEWMKNHPTKNDLESYLWLTNNGERLKYEALARLLKVYAKKVGINKRIHPHLFRHSRASRLASKIPESYLRKCMGWTGDSKMVSTYVHLNSNDVDNVLLKRIYGMKSEKIEEMVEKLAPKVCYNCGERNPQDYEFCLNCKLPLDIESIKMGEKRFLLPIIQKMIDRRMEERRIKKVG
jgi:site-specific recombinase XerD